MNRRTLCLAGLAALLPAAILLPAALLLPTPARAQTHAAVLSDTDQEELTKISFYLNGLRSLRARFLQIAPDGATTQGSLWLERPGRMRFEYDKPSPLLLVAGGGTVVFHDSQLDQTTNIPIGQTPLGLLLADTITLTGPGSQSTTITEFDHPPGQILVTLVRTRTPGDGSLTLALNPDPPALIGWSVVDAQGRETRLRMTDIRPGGSFDPKLFTFIDPDQGK